MRQAVLWVQHLLGTGHTVRAAALGHALSERGVRVRMVLGATPPATLDLTGLDVLALPPVRAADTSFASIIGDDGTPYAELATRRRDLFAAAAGDADLLLTETFPLGRRAFASELLPVLQARAGRSLRAASVRDVLVRKPPRKEAAMAALASEHYDLVLVHADPDFVTLADSFSGADAIASITSYTGFVHATAPPIESRDGEDEVLVSSGGGAVGANLASCAIEAARRLGAAHRWRILLSPALAAEHLDAWTRAAPGHVVIEPNRPDFRVLLANAALSVSQAGYNTVLDVMVAGVRAIFVPFAAHAETEQTERAEALARRGLATHMPEATLDPAKLAAAVTSLLAAPPPARPAIDVDGASKSADILLEALDRGQR